ncbi:zinc knuckle CX2CX4HX4C containing protein [Tanacetum coccineum]
MDNLDVDFSVAAVWDSIRPRSIEVDWFHVVWFSHHIPRYAIHLWLVIKRKLKTHDLLRPWDLCNNHYMNQLVCPLCEVQPDSHDHLFFGCRFSSWVWDNLKPLLCIPNVPSALDDIVAFLIPVAKMKSIRSVVCKLVFSAACYFLWQERNYRIFKKKKRSKDKILELIKSNVRLKLLTCSFKKTPNVQMLAHIWKLPSSLVRPSPTLV